MAGPTRPPANAFVSAMRHVYNPIGFSKGYNFVLFFIFAGAFMGFILARFQFLSINGVFCAKVSSGSHAAPGECYYYLGPGIEKIGIILHLATILPAGFLAIFQFVPAIRHKVITFHRVNGYIVILLALVGTVGAIMITRHAFGGDLSTQYACGLMAIMFAGSLIMAYINIKRLQIEEHRAWMLRAWFYAGTIVTLRLIDLLGAIIVTKIGGYFAVRDCAEIANIYGSQNVTLSRYPECAPYYSGANSDQHTIVAASFPGKPEQVAVALGINFGASMWLALAMHAIGVEIYLKLTPAEKERLRNVSYQRQVEAGMKNPGNAGLTVNRFGDAERWTAKEPESLDPYSSAGDQ